MLHGIFHQHLQGAGQNGNVVGVWIDGMFDPDVVIKTDAKKKMVVAEEFKLVLQRHVLFFFVP